MTDKADYFGIFVAGCGCSCGCSAYLRVECASGVWVRKLGDRFLVYDLDNRVIGKAEPGFTPLPEDADWVAHVKYTREHSLPHPYDKETTKR
jgi:hypothetical protein